METKFTQKERQMLDPVERIVNCVFPIEEREKELKRLYKKAERSVNKDER